jgi:prevent-host-death family protein
MPLKYFRPSSGAMYRVYHAGLQYHVGMDAKTMGTREFRDQIGQRVEAAHFQGEPTVVTHNGKPRAVLIPYDEWIALRSPKVGPTTRR